MIQQKLEDQSGPSSHHLHQWLLLLHQLRGSLVRPLHQLSDLLVDQLGRGLAVRLLRDHFTLPGQVKRHLPHLLTHPKLHHLGGFEGENQVSQQEKEIKNKQTLQVCVCVVPEHRRTA